jgi:hypothetical protein
MFCRPDENRFFRARYFLSFIFVASFCGCGLFGSRPGVMQKPNPTPKQISNASPSPAPTSLSLNSPSRIPDLAFPSTASKTMSPIGNVDFRNRDYPLPHGWQDADGDEATVVNGERKLSKERIGLEYVTTRYFDIVGTKDDEAIVVLRINTAGNAIPQIVYVFTMNGDSPELIWFFRTGDRADGGLKDVRAENGELVVELYGQDRYIYGDVETQKIEGDEEQLCCPKFFTRNRYKWNGRTFVLQGKREIYPVTDKNEPLQGNKSDLSNNNKGTKNSH